jgi:hypothetical protein
MGRKNQRGDFGGSNPSSTKFSLGGDPESWHRLFEFLVSLLAGRLRRQGRSFPGRLRLKLRKLGKENSSVTEQNPQLWRTRSGIQDRIEGMKTDMEEPKIAAWKWSRQTTDLAQKQGVTWTTLTRYKFFFIENQQDYNWTTEVTALHLCNTHFLQE